MGSVVENHSWKNPLRIDLQRVVLPQWEVKEVALSSNHAGFINNPNPIVVYLDVRQTSGKSISFQPHTDQLLISLWKQKKKIYDFVSIKVGYLSNHKYQIFLPLPPVDSAGEYQIRIQFYNHFIGPKKGEPQEFIKKISYFEEKQNFIFLVDNSGSMQKNDPQGKRLSSIFQTFSDPDLARIIQEIAIFTFSDSTELIYRGSPNISQQQIFQKLSKQIPKGGTDIAGAISYIAKFIQSTAWKGEVTVVFLTDGVASTAYHQQHMLLKKQGVSLFSVGLSDSKQKEYDENFLYKIAVETGGQFISSSSSSIKNIYQQIIKKRCSTLKKQSSIRVIIPGEIPFLQLSDVKLGSSLKILVNEKITPIFFKKNLGNTIQLGLFPMKIGLYQTKVLYIDQENKQQKYELSFQVVEKDTVYQVVGNFFQIPLLRNQVLRIPFSLQNLWNQPQIFSISFLDLPGDLTKFSSNYIRVDQENMYVNSKEVLLNSLEITAPPEQPVGEYHGYFLVYMGARAFIKEISLSIKDTVPVPIVTKFPSYYQVFSSKQQNYQVNILLLLVVGIGWMLWGKKGNL